MDFLSKLILLLLLFNLEICLAQAIFDTLNNLPNTIEVKAPEFNTEKKFVFRVDSIRKKLYIQDIRISSKGDCHFYQWLYEVPLNHIDSNSFKVSKIDDEIKITISTLKNVKSINHYWFQDNKVNSIMTIATLVLGKWTYSDELFKDFEGKVAKVAKSLPNIEETKIEIKNDSGTFKFVAHNVTQRNVNFSNDLTIGDGYRFKQFIFDGDLSVSDKTISQVKKTLKRKNIEIKYPIPVLVYISGGEVENIFIVNNQTTEYLDVDISKIRQFKKVKVRTKYIFLLDKNL